MLASIVGVQLDPQTALSDRALWRAAKPGATIAPLLFAGGAGGAWYDPSDLTSLWQDAAATVAVTANDNPVRLMRDLSGNARHALAPSDAARPLYKSGNTVLFDAVDDRLVTSGLTNGTYTLCVIANNRLYVQRGIRVTDGTHPVPRINVRAMGLVAGSMSDATIATLAALYGVSSQIGNMLLFANAQTSVSARFDTTGAVAWSVDWGDATSATPASAATASKTYSPAFTGVVVITAAATLTRCESVLGNLQFDLSAVPNTTATFHCLGSNTISGALSSLPAGMTSFTCSGSNTVSGALSGLPSTLTFFHCTGTNTISGNLSSLPSTLPYFDCRGANTVTIGSPVWRTSSMTYVRLDGALTSGEVDDLIIRLGNVVSWINIRRVDLQFGGNAPRTSASDAARATIIGLGAAVNTA